MRSWASEYERSSSSTRPSIRRDRLRIAPERAPKRRRRAYGHDLDLALLRRQPALEAEHPVERADRDLDLVERGGPGRQALEPEPRREDCAQDRVLRVLAGEADHLVGDAGDHGQEQDPRGDQPEPARLAHEGEHEDGDHHHVQEEGGAAADVDEAAALDDLRLERVACLVGVDRLVLGRVVLEHAPQVGEEPDDHEVEDEDRHADEPLHDDEPRGRLDRQPARDQRRRDLEEQKSEADREAEGEEELSARELGLNLPVLTSSWAPRSVRGDREGAESDRQRLAQREDAADDRQARSAVLEQERGDRPVDLGDLAAQLADGDRPRGRAAHHHALQDGLAPDGRAHGPRSPLLLVAAAAARLLQAALELLDAPARVHESVTRRRDCTLSRSRHEARPWWSDLERVPRRSTTVARTYSGWISVFMNRPGAGRA